MGKMTKVDSLYQFQHPSPMVAPKGPTFHKFPKLPPELRQMIFKMSFPEERIVEVFNNYSWRNSEDEVRACYTVGSNIIQPAVLSICRESRTVALKSCETLLLPRSLVTTTRGRVVVKGYIHMRINWESDTLQYNCETALLAPLFLIQNCMHVIIDVGPSYAKCALDTTPFDQIWKTTVVNKLLPTQLSRLKSAKFILGGEALREPRPRRNQWEKYSNHVFVDVDQELVDLVCYLRNADTRLERDCSISNLDPVRNLCITLEECKIYHEICRESDAGKHLTLLEFSVAFPAQRIHGFWNNALGWEVIYPLQFSKEEFWPDGYDENCVKDGVLHCFGRRQLCEPDGSLINHYEGVSQLFAET